MMILGLQDVPVSNLVLSKHHARKVNQKSPAFIELLASVKLSGILVPIAVYKDGAKYIVIAGQREAVERAMELAKEKGATMAIPLPVSVPSHCELMRPAAERLRTFLETIPMQKPEIPVIHNVDVATHEQPDEIKKALVQQLFSPVRWVETIELMYQQGIHTLVECGPNKVLSGLTKRINRNIQNFSTHDNISFSKTLDAIKEAVCS